MWQEILPVPPPSTLSHHSLLSHAAAPLSSRDFSVRSITRASCVSRRGQAPWEQETWPSCLPWRSLGFHRNVLLRAKKIITPQSSPHHPLTILSWHPMITSPGEYPPQRTRQVPTFIQWLHGIPHCHPHVHAHPDITLLILTHPPLGHPILQLNPMAILGCLATPQLFPQFCLSQTTHAMGFLPTQGT